MKKQDYKIPDRNYTTKELLDFLWKVVDNVQKQPEMAPHHKFAKEYASTIIVFNIIHAFEKGKLELFGEGTDFH